MKQAIKSFFVMVGMYLAILLGIVLLSPPTATSSAAAEPAFELEAAGTIGHVRIRHADVFEYRGGAIYEDTATGRRYFALTGCGIVELNPEPLPSREAEDDDP